MLFKKIDILDEDLKHRKNYYVGITEDKIEYIGDKMPEKDFGEVIDGNRKLLMSGFFNAHAHTPMTLMRGYGENLNLHDWLNTRIFPFEDKITGEAAYYGSLLSYAESVRYGIVSTSDMYYFCEDIARAALEAEVKTNLSRALVSFVDEDLYKTASFNEAKSLFENWNGANENKIIIDMSLHAEYTSNPRTVSSLAEYTKKIDANMQVHVSETLKEHEECKERHGKTPTEYLADLGLFDTKATAAHCVYIEEKDMDILKNKGVTVAANPVSNLKLGSGVCKISELLNKGINVAIGTDSVASNNNLDYLGEIKTFGLLAKNQDIFITPETILRAATRNGAAAQGRDDTGILKEGYKADLVVIDLDKPHLFPCHDMATNIVFSASGQDVFMTVVDGKVLYKDGEYKTIDLERVYRETQKKLDSILLKLK